MVYEMMPITAAWLEELLLQVEMMSTATDVQ